MFGDSRATGFAELFPQLRVLEQSHDRGGERLRIGGLDEQPVSSWITASGIPPAFVPTTA